MLATMPLTRRHLLGTALLVPALRPLAAQSGRGWPTVVTAPEVHVSAAGSRDGGTVFQSPHFDFWVESEISTPLMNDFARCAEATRRLWRALPLGLPEDSAATRQLVQIWKNDDSYRAAGGPPRTAGFFRGGPDGRGQLLVNAESLGVDSFNGRTTKGRGYRPSVLVHELSHQATALWLPLLPLWLREGLAEYGALVPYADGTFRLDADALRTALRRRCDFFRSSPDDPFATRPAPSAFGPTGNLARWLVPVPDLTDEAKTAALMHSPRLIDPHRVYFSSLLVVFYLLHLDAPTAPGNLRPALHFFDALTATARRFARDEADVELPPELKNEDRGPHRDRRHSLFAALSPRLWQNGGPAEVEAKLQPAFEKIGVRLSP